MNFREIKEFLNTLSEEELNQNVDVDNIWSNSEYTCFDEIRFERTEENYYERSSGETLAKESEIKDEYIDDEGEEEGTRLFNKFISENQIDVKKGTPIIFVREMN